jgi:hypothetical protein
LTPDTYDIHALDEMLNSEGWRKVARAAIQQRAKHLRDRIATEHFTDLGALHAAQAEYRVLKTLGDDPRDYFTPRPE